MPEKFSLALFSPSGILGQTDSCVQISLPGKSGELVLLPNAMPCLVALRRGFILVKDVHEEEKKYYISGGICQISKKGMSVSVFSDEVIDVKDDKAMKECMDKIGFEPIVLSKSTAFQKGKFH